MGLTTIKSLQHGLLSCRCQDMQSHIGQGGLLKPQHKDILDLIIYYYFHYSKKL